MTCTKIISAFTLAITLLISSTTMADSLCSEPVETNSGLVRGQAETETATCVWRGVPYAAPPVGMLRWKAPQPTPPWSGVRDTTQFGHICMQRGGEGMSEDCLYLNIWRPAKSGSFPVIVFIHGGGYHGGSGNLRGDRLSQAGDVVIVSINYRLNIFGFMAHPKLRKASPHNSTGGYGAMDQAYSLKWVQENIEAFGGDPENVTIFGQSAGGQSICSMIATPLARGMFQRAIFQGGGGQAAYELEQAYEIARGSFEKAGCGFDDIDCMLDMPADGLLAKAAGHISKAFDYYPCIDGYVLTGTPQEMIEAGDFSRVPVLAGSNLDEFAMAVNLVPKYFFAMPFQYENKIIKGMGATPEEAKRLTELYPLSDFGNRPNRAMARMYAADAALTCPMRSSVAAIVDQGLPAYLFKFEYKGMKYGKVLGSFHGAELPFIFGELDRDRLYNSHNIEEAQELGRIIQGYWLNFAKTGDPNGEGLPEWKRFDSDEQRIQILDVEVRNVPHPDAEKCDFWDGYSTPYTELVNLLLDQLDPRKKTKPRLTPDN